jgi:adenine-specific DNA-methyltransferase
MKYMGSKRAMLTNGLGELISHTITGRDRFVDLFAGSGSVSKFVASNSRLPVLATDLQAYAAILSGAVLHRTTVINTEEVWVLWYDRANSYLQQEPHLLELADALELHYPSALDTHAYSEIITTIRDICFLLPSSFPLSRAYGGHYFGLRQAIWLDALRATVPDGSFRELAIAALIETASECSASPGHTAQPFAPTSSGMPHLINAWERCVATRAQNCFAAIAKQHAQVLGSAFTCDAVKATEILNEKDLVFVDPPYSEVQYSRFYHVLEGVAIGQVEDVSGVGRYPSLLLRPQSNFSRKAPARNEFDRLMIGIAAAGAEAIVTFPEASASNGLSGALVEDISDQYFQVARRAVKSTFSTLGGTGKTRNARQGTTELILHLLPRGC